MCHPGLLPWFKIQTCKFFFFKPVHVFPNKILGKEVIVSEYGLKKVTLPATVASDFLVNTLLQYENM